MDYLIHLLILLSIYAILGIGLNLLLGYTGLMSLTQASFFGIGAYVTALLLIHTQTGFLLSVLLGVIIVVPVSLFLELISDQFNKDNYMLVSLGLNVIIFGLFNNLYNLTNGAVGISAIPRPILLGIDFSSNFYFLLLVLIFLLLIYLLSYYIVRTSFGRVLKTIREDENVSRSFGFNTRHYKLAIFAIAAAMAAVAGSLYASYFSFIDPSNFSVTTSIMILSITIIGGLASLTGTLIGSLFFVLFPEFLRFVGFPSEAAFQLRQAAFGLTIIVLMMFRPQGLMGKYKL
ncbi:MAG TPA: branched-chain amino acid ABC transporter permease [Patescibacteria group bacterium]|nr:branched-chain amino acid ABC transporter permease [Patescibacteria group bacterium]